MVSPLSCLQCQSVFVFPNEPFVHLAVCPFSYVASRVYLHDPPGEHDTLAEHPDAPLALLDEEEHLIHGEPEVNQWVCLGMLAVTIALMAATAEWVC